MEVTWQMFAWAVVLFIPGSFILSCITGWNLTAWKDNFIAEILVIGSAFVAGGLLGLDQASGLVDGLAAFAALAMGTYMGSLGLRVAVEPRY